MTWLDAPKSEHVVRREHYVAGREDERERIIALLEHERYYTNGDDQFETAHSVPCVTCKNIALIKGENE